MPHYGVEVAAGSGTGATAMSGRRRAIDNQKKMEDMEMSCSTGICMTEAKL